jgi:hypothetical protein
MADLGSPEKLRQYHPRFTLVLHVGLSNRSYQVTFFEPKSDEDVDREADA